MTALTPRPLPANFIIAKGHHNNCGPDHPGCVMDWTSYVCGYPSITDHPPCASPVATTFAITLNDAMPDDLRTAMLSPLVPVLAASAASPEVELKRMFFLADRAVRTFAPLALDAAGFPLAAATLRELPPVTDAHSAEGAADSAEGIASIWQLAADTLRECCEITA